MDWLARVFVGVSVFFYLFDTSFKLKQSSNNQKEDGQNNFQCIFVVLVVLRRVVSTLYQLLLCLLNIIYNMCLGVFSKQNTIGVSDAKKNGAQSRPIIGNFAIQVQ